MKTKILLLLFVGVALLASLAHLVPVADQDPDEPAPSGADAFYIEPANYAPLVKSAKAGDCDAAFTLARYHAFCKTEFDASVQWYRVAARCPHLNAKRSLLLMIRNLPEHDREVDRLLEEIASIDPTTGEEDRRQVATMRAKR